MRSLFHVPDNYFLSHSVGCLPKTAKARLESDFWQSWETGRNWADWMPVLDRYRSSIAALLNVNASTICPQTNISSALTKILYALPQREGRTRLVLSREDFPTVGFVMQQAERAGYELVFVDDAMDLESWQHTIDDRTALVHVTHVLSNRSNMLPVAEICQLAQRSGAVSVVDVAQSLGIVSVDPIRWGADFVTGTGVKYLCCGPGACFLYASPERISDCKPVDVGWFSHQDPFEMDIERFRYAEDAMRFFGGTPSPAPFAMANAALDIWRNGNLYAVQSSIQNKLTCLVETIPKGWLQSPDNPDKRGGTLVVKPPEDGSALRQKLDKEGALYDERRTGFRFSVHVYTSDEEINRLARIIAG